MILLVHIIFGAAIGSLLMQYPISAIILAFLGHYFLDLLPHIEYSIKNIPMIILDFLSGILLIFFFSSNQTIIYACALASLVPDGLTVLGKIISNKFFKNHDKIHEKAHFLKHKKIPVFTRIFTQSIIVILSLLSFSLKIP
jgi:hypothetical protein